MQMKLLTKLTIRYVLFSLAALVVSGVAIYIVLAYIITGQLDERLGENLQKVENQLGKIPEPVFIDPFVEVTKTDNPPTNIIFSDTLIFNEQENEMEEYRKLSKTGLQNHCAGIENRIGRFIVNTGANHFCCNNSVNCNSYLCKPACGQIHMETFLRKS